MGLLKAEVTADCSNLVTECDALAAFCERNLNGEQDSPLEFDLPAAKAEANDFKPPPRVEEIDDEPPKIEEVPDDAEIVDGVVIEEIEPEKPGKPEPAAPAQKMTYTAAKYAGGASVKILGESNWSGVLELAS